MRSFVQSPRFGRIASRLLRAPAVRLYHEQALFKPPGGTDSHWHQDQFYFPFDDTFTMGLWMPLVDCSLDMGPPQVPPAGSTLLRIDCGVQSVRVKYACTKCCARAHSCCGPEQPHGAIPRTGGLKRC